MITAILALLGGFAGLFFWERGKRKSAEVKADSAEYTAGQKVFIEKTKEAMDEVLKGKQSLEELKKQHDKVIKDNKELSKEEIEDYWNSRKSER